jgi:hypothetical protein
MKAFADETRSRQPFQFFTMFAAITTRGSRCMYTSTYIGIELNQMKKINRKI